MSLGEQKEFKFKWQIERFPFSKEKNGEYLSSPVFTADCIQLQSKWCLHLYPRGYNDKSTGHISIYLKNVDLKLGPIKLFFSVELMTSNNIQMAEVHDERLFETTQSFGKEKWVELEKLGNLMDVYSTTLNVICHMKVVDSKQSVPTSCEATTKLGVDEYSFKWGIKMPDESRWSECNSCVLNDSSTVKVVLTCPEDDILINIRPTNDKSLPGHIRCKICLLDNQGREYVSKSDECFFLTIDSLFKFPDFIKKSELNDKKETLQSDEEFVLEFHFWISNKTTLSEVKKYTYRDYANNGHFDKVPTLTDNLKIAFDNKLYSNIQLKVDEQIIHCHKAILAARSHVFKAMFDQNMTENQTGIIKIEDFDADTLKDLINFIYTDKVEELDCDRALNLLLASDKYQVLLLKEKCIVYLMSIISSENYLKIFVASDVMGHKMLNNFVIEYVKMNSERLLHLPEFTEWLNKNQGLGIQILTKISCSRASTKY